MESPRKQDKKKNIKTLPAVINIGAGWFGVGGILLVGGALVAATIVSALVFKTRSQRRSSSENTKKNMSQSFDAPNKLELMIKTSKDFADDTSPLEVQNPSDEVTTMKEIQTKSIQILTPDESGDGNEDVIVSVVGEDTSFHVDSAFESQEVDISCEKMDLDSDEQVVVAAQVKEDSCLERSEELLDNENDADSLVSDEGVKSIEEYDVIEAPVKDVVSENEDGGGEDNEETIFVNEGGVATMEAVCINQVKVLEEIEKDSHDEIILENGEGHFSDETGYADQIVHEVVMEEEKDEETGQNDEEQVTVEDELLIEAAKVDDQAEKQPSELMNKEEKEEETDVQVKVEMFAEHELLKKDEIPHVQCVKEDDDIEEDVAIKDYTPPSPLINEEEKDKETEQRVDEQKVFNTDEKDNAYEMPQDQLNESAKVDDDTAKETEHELVKKDEVPHVQSVKQDEDSDEDFTIKAKLSSDRLEDSELSPEAKISNHKIKGNQTILGEKQTFAGESWNLKLMTWLVLISVLSLFGSLLFILILLGYRNSAT